MKYMRSPNARNMLILSHTGNKDIANDNAFPDMNRNVADEIVLLSVMVLIVD